MKIADIIRKKRSSEALTPEEIKFVVSSYTKGETADYQMAALLMAICIRGLNAAEISVLTRAMLESGITLDLSSVPGMKIDKHSTGGVGDGTSLIVAPLAASLGVKVPMMAGRGLEHTGGTIDKLEAIPNFSANLNKDDFLKNLKQVGAAICGQTSEIAPADDKMYALRDVTGTVDSIPLIASSIMSKKLAEGCDGLVLDVKTGTGAFSKTVAEAKTLAKEMIRIAESFDKKAVGLITDMNQPLGNAVGNSLEIIQAVELMKGKGPKDLKDLVIELTVRMLVLAGNKNTSEIRALAVENLSNGKALAKFKEIVEAQGGDGRVVDTPENVLPQAAKKYELKAAEKGFTDYTDTRSIGIAANLLGAGRFKKGDKIDFGAGITILKKQGDAVEKNEPLAIFHYNNDGSMEEAELRFWDGVRVSKKRVKSRALILGEMSTSA